MTTAAVIPARGGSKRIPGKNIRDFCGRPIIAHSIAAARDCGRCERILVSTDDERIAVVARDCGAEVPFMRPATLADDHTGTGAVVAHAVAWLGARDPALDLVCCLYATAPLVDPAQLRRGHDLLRADADAQFAVSVAAFPFPIQRAVAIDAAGGLSMREPEHLTTRSQDLPEFHHDAGQFYWGRPGAWLTELPLFAPHSRAVVLPRESVQDIDTEEDWRVAEALFRLRRERRAEAAG